MVWLNGQSKSDTNMCEIAMLFRIIATLSTHVRRVTENIHIYKQNIHDLTSKHIYRF